MRLSAVLPESAIVVGLSGLDKWGVIAKLTDLLVASDQAQLAWRDAILRALHEREKQSSTGMQDGFAIPHARMDEPIQNTLVSWRSLAQGMDFDAIDGQPTRTVVCLITLASRTATPRGAGLDRPALRPRGVPQRPARGGQPEEVLAVIRAEEDKISN
jgi:PTS system fructose-specific IIC component